MLRRRVRQTSAAHVTTINDNNGNDAYEENDDGVHFNQSSTRLVEKEISRPPDERERERENNIERQSY